MNGLNGKVVLVTGGNSGIGRAAALLCASRAAKVVIAARDATRGQRVADQITSQGGDAIFVRTDVANNSDVQTLVEHTVRHYGRLDCALNNAALGEGLFQDTADFGEDEFDRVVGVNLKGVWLCMKHEIHQMLAQDLPGAIVNTSSVNGLGAAPQGAVYSATKAGVLALTKAAAQEYATHGIRVNALVAGAFATPMLAGVFERYAQHQGVSPEEVETRYTSLIPMRRIGRPEEAAQAAVWLCSEQASYVTGHSMIVDGGLTCPVR